MKQLADEIEALKKNKGRYLKNRETDPDVFKPALYCRQPKYCIDHMAWYEDAAKVEGLDETPEEVDTRKKTLYFAMDLYNPRIDVIIRIFKDVGEVVRVQIIGDDAGNYVGCGFLEFTSANEAKNALKQKKGAKIYLKMAERARYPIRSKYNLENKLQYEDNLRQESHDFKTIRNLEKRGKQSGGFRGTKTAFSDGE